MRRARREESKLFFVARLKNTAVRFRSPSLKVDFGRPFRRAFREIVASFVFPRGNETRKVVDVDVRARPRHTRPRLPARASRSSRSFSARSPSRASRDAEPVAGREASADARDDGAEKARRAQGRTSRPLARPPFAAVDANARAAGGVGGSAASRASRDAEFSFPRPRPRAPPGLGPLPHPDGRRAPRCRATWRAPSFASCSRARASRPPRRGPRGDAHHRRAAEAARAPVARARARARAARARGSRRSPDATDAAVKAAAQGGAAPRGVRQGARPADLGAHRVGVARAGIDRAPARREDRLLRAPR